MSHTVKLKNNGTNPMAFILADGTPVTIPPRGGEVEVSEADQRDVDGFHDLAERCKRVADKESERTGRDVLPQLEVHGGNMSSEAKKNVRPEPVVRTASEVPAPKAHAKTEK